MQHSDLVGVWQRESLSIEDGEPFEDSNVLWLHAGNHFADIRWPKPGEDLARVSAFAGRATWTNPRMHFEHLLDLTRGVTEDTGIMTFENDKLIEQGQVNVSGKVIRFQEVWQRLTRADIDSCTVATIEVDQETGYIVRVNDYAIAMNETKTGFCAAAWKLENESWQQRIGIGDVSRLAQLSQLRDSLITNNLSEGWQQQDQTL